MSTAVLDTYEARLDRNPRWALSEGSRHFEETSAVFTALHKIAARLEKLGVGYAVVGGMALFRHGVRRFTEDVDILMTKDDHRKVRDELRDDENGVRIKCLIAGEFPGDGREKPVAFPDPRGVSFEADGVRYINLPTLVELKLASGMTNPGRLKDLADVIELIKTLNLLADFADRLNPYVREQFATLWKSVAESAGLEQE